MTRRKATNTLHVGINGRHVGQLTRSAGNYTFTYDEDWLVSEDAHPISLSMPLTKPRHTGNEVRYYFDNLLPDDDAIRRLIVDRVGAYSTDTMDLLTEIGRDCVGALSFTSQPVNALPEMEVCPLTDAEIEAHLQRTATRRTLGMDSEGAFRISLAGAQEKTALTKVNDAWYQPIGSTPTTHIFKLPIGKLPDGTDLGTSVDNEWFCLRFLHHLGFPTAHADIRTFGDTKVLVVERFDRVLGEDERLYRLTQEDMCQATGKAGQSKYENHGGPGAREIAEVLKYSSNSLQDQYTFFYSQYMFWLMMGIDGHAKNFSVFIDHSGHWLTPLYDVVSAHPVSDKFSRRQLKMAMRVLSKNSHYNWHDIQSRHWQSHARKTGLNADAAIAGVEQITQGIESAIDETFADACVDFDRDTGESIAQGILSSVEKMRR